MAMGRPKAELVLSGDERTQLESMARSRSLPAALVQRANLILASGEGAANSAVAKRFGVTNATVGKWRQRFLVQRIAGLLTTTLHHKPKDGGTHWSVRGLAAETGISKTSVHRFLQVFGLQPHRQDTFKLSTDPFFVEKLRDVVGLYLNPPDNALVLCVDEKSQIQALERTQPLLPMGFGYVEGVTHDYVRHGTTTLFAALDVANGQVISRVRTQHRHQEFLDFLRQIDRQTPPDLDLHLIADNYITHKHAKVKAWLARNPRVHMHFTPTYSSWINQVERWFALITERAIRRNSFTSVRELKQQIELFVQRHNADTTPFKWVATADSILQKVEKIAKRISA